MGGWGIVFLVVVLQAVVAAVGLIFFKRLLDKELIEAALEKFQTWEAAKTADRIALRLHSLDPRIRDRFEELSRRRFPSAQLTFELDAGIKGGAVISAGSEELDFSMASRLRTFWS